MWTDACGQLLKIKKKRFLNNFKYNVTILCWGVKTKEWHLQKNDIYSEEGNVYYTQDFS